MANSKNTVRFVIKAQTEGGEEIKALKVKSEDLRAAIQSVQRQTSKGIKATVKVNGVNQAEKNLLSLKKMFGSLDGSIKKIGLPPALQNMGSSIMGSLANPYLLAGTAIAGAGKALFDYNKELERSLMKTQQFTKLSGNELMSLRNGIKSVADTFGKDFDTVLSSVDGLMNQFHITGEEALKVIKDGFVGGADDGGKMLDMISKYGPAFHDAGISASELVAIIGNTRNGIFDENGMELISKAAQKIREMSKTTAEALDSIGISSQKMQQDLQNGNITTMQALQQVSSKLKELPPQSNEVGMVLKDVFGKQGAKAGYELVTALADVETNLEAVKAQTGEWGVAMAELETADRELENALSSLFGIADGGFTTMTTKLKAEVYGAVAKVINGFIDLYNKSILVRGSIEIMALTFKNAWEVIKGILQLFMTGVGTVSEMLENIWDFKKLKLAWDKGSKEIADGLKKTAEAIHQNYDKAIEEIFNGQIKKIEIEADVTYTENFKGGLKGGEGNLAKEDKPKKEPKPNPVKTEIELKREALEKVRKELQLAVSDFNAGFISKEDLIQKQKASNDYFKENGIKEKIGLDFSGKNGFEKAKIKILDEVQDLQFNLPKIKIDFELKGKDLFKDKEKEAEEFRKKIGLADSAVNSFGQALSNLAGDNEVLAKSAYIAQAIGQLVLGFAKAMSGPKDPWTWIAAGIAGTATLTSIIGQFHTFAEGGIISGPTFGLMGEYAGASNNPEVVAPLNKLQSLIEPREPMFGEVVFKIDGKVIKGVLKNVDRFDSRTR